jgi:hypothetical protein
LPAASSDTARGDGAVVVVAASSCTSGSDLVAVSMGS